MATMLISIELCIDIVDLERLLNDHNDVSEQGSMCLNVRCSQYFNGQMPLVAQRP